MRHRLAAVKGFMPYIAVLFLNAFVDLGHKILIQNTVFKVYDGTLQIVLTAIVNALILLPFIVFFIPAGFCSDRWPKNIVMRTAAWLAVLLTLLITACYYLGWFWQAFAMTFILAAQSAFYSPAKYAYIKSLVGVERLSAANGIVQSVTIVAILAATFIFSIAFEYGYQSVVTVDPINILQAIAPLGWLLVINSVIELVMAYRLPELEKHRPELRFSVANYFKVTQVSEAIKPVLHQPIIIVAIMGLATFWSASQLILATFPAFVKQELGVVNTVAIQGVMSVSGIGIVIGALIAGKIGAAVKAGTGLSLHYLLVAAVGISGCLLCVSILPSLLWHAINFLMLGFFGGLFIVPLNTVIQLYGEAHQLGKILAANNFLQNIAMFSVLVLAAGFAYWGVGANYLLFLIAVIALLGCGYSAINVIRLQNKKV